MKKSKLAIASFILSLIPIIVAIKLVWTVSGPTTVTIGDGTQVVNLLDGWNIFGAFILAFIYSSIMTFWVGIFAIILGIIALVKVKRNNLKGKGFAVAGIVISLIPAIFWVIYFIVNYFQAVNYDERIIRYPKSPQ